MILALTVSRQFVFIGAIEGLAYALLALGVILIYRSSRTINFAVGAAGVLAAQVMSQVVIRYGAPYWAGFAVALATGAAFLAVAELTVVRRLFTAPRVILLVATIGLSQLAEALMFALPEPSVEENRRDFPSPWTTEYEWLGVRIVGSELLLLVASATAVVALALWMARSAWGRAIRASAADPDRARLAGINPGTVSTIVWTLTGTFAALVTVLLEAGSTRAFIGASPGYSLMTRVLVVAVCASFLHFGRAVTAGIIFGIIEAIVRVNYPLDLGRFEAVLLVAAVIAVFVTTRRDSGDERESFSFAPRVRPIPPSVREVWWVRHHTRILGTVAVAVAAIIPVIITAASRTFRFSEIILVALAALSLVVLGGWSGQISLGQGAFAGLGALTTAALVSGRDLGLGAAGLDVSVPIPELHFLLAVVVATAATAVVAVIIGLGALRVRGLLLAVITLAFAVSAEKFFFRRPFLSDNSTTSALLERASLGPVDLAPQRTYYYLALGALIVGIVFVARLRRTGVGRRIIATRENPDGAASFTVWPTGAKITAYAVSGGIAGFAGALLGGLYATILFSFFSAGRSIEILAVAVIGGIGSVAGPVLGALWVVGLPAFWPDSPTVALLTSSLGILILLMYVPGGFVQLWYLARDGLLRWYAQRRPEQPAPAITIPRRDPVPAPPHDTALAATGVAVRFGPRVAVNQVDLRVAHGEIVGLIGTNGAGKTTFMNAVAGLVPARGTVMIYGTDVSSLPSHRRHALGLGRTFQAAPLFPDLTVQETVQVALESGQTTRFVPAAVPGLGGAAHERRQAAAARDLIDFLGLGDYANSFVAELSTGTRRIVELTCLVAGGNRLLCLDEPTAGVAQREAEALVPLLHGIRRELDASVLIIEHDMPMITAISDRIYCLEQGTVIAEGLPEDVRDNPQVIAAYLGTDERAIARSDVGAAP
ncbi:ABC transporter permease subunit [Candidatus Poriferisocius sp.]|uniref:ABC transporter permease subunit n=1 Tax=Candidatus Poriferisocius sp. TaxID=3101276 RepID=UPI003B5CB3D1